MPPQDPQTAHWFDEEVRPHAEGLRAWLRARFPAAGDPDDLIQEAYMRLLRAREAGRIINARAFLYTTARNVALDVFRRNQVVRMEPLVNPAARDVEAEGDGVAEIVSRGQELEILYDAIQALPPRCREIMTLQKIHGLTNGEIAAKLGISVYTVNAQMVIGLMRCRQFLRDRGVLRGPGS